MTPYFDDGAVTLYLGDAREVLCELPDESVDALVTDPPAGIEFMGKAWDSFRASAATPSGTQSDAWGDFGDNPFARGATPRFNGKSTRVLSDARRGFISALTPIFAEALRVLKPGAHGVVWTLPRTSHWTATALEDAGFEIRDSIAHLFGSGFPKSLDAERAIDMELCVQPGRHYMRSLPTLDKRRADDHVCPSTPEGDVWSGFGSALKPASELWLLIRKPLAEDTVAANVLAHGAGALNVDACRIHTAGSEAKEYVVRRLGPGATNNRTGAWKQDAEYAGETRAGRWPANVVLSHHPLCEIVGERVVDNKSASEGGGRDGNDFADVGRERRAGKPGGREYGLEAVEVWDCIPGCAVALLDAQSGDLQSGFMRAGTPRNNRMGYGGATAPNTAAQTYGDMGGASRFFYVAKPSTAEKQDALRSLSLFDADPATKPHRNAHPTVKPVELMRYLCRLVTPPGGTILDPFAGSGTTGVAALAEGFDITMIERDPDSVATARARCERAALGSGVA